MNISMSKLFFGDLNSLIFELSRLTLAHFVLQGTTGALPFSAGARAPTDGPGLAPPIITRSESQRAINFP